MAGRHGQDLRRFPSKNVDFAQVLVDIFGNWLFSESLLWNTGLNCCFFPHFPTLISVFKYVTKDQLFDRSLIHIMYSNNKQRVEVQVMSSCVEESQEEGWCLVGEEFRQEAGYKKITF